jgi:branched-chain amino acid transport system substrate-binding protein
MSRWSVGLAALAVLVAVPGCGTASADSTARRAPIVIGVVCSCTGAEASSTATGPPTFQAWADAVNASGGIEGHQVKVISTNDALNPGTSLAEVERMVSQDHVVGLVDDSVVDSSWEAYVQDHHVPVLGGNLSNSSFYTNPDFFPEGTTQNFLADQIVLEAKKAGAKNLAVLYCASAVQCEEAVPPIKSVGQKDGVPLVFSAAISTSAPNFVAPCLAAKQAGATSINVAAAAAVVTSVAASCSQQGYTPIQLGIGGSVGLSWAKAPGMDGTIATENDMPFFVTSTTATRAMRAALEKYEPAVLSSPNFGEAVTNSWASGLLIEAAARAGGVTPGVPVSAAKLVNGLYALHGTTLDGMAPPLTFHRGKASSVSCFFYMRIEKGTFTTPYGTTPSCVGP